LSGNDTIFGSSGDDWRGLVGVDAGNDLYNMGTGDDWVNGGIGNDTIDGGDGYDNLSYDQTAWNEGIPMVRGITVDVTAGTVLDPYGYTDHITGIEEIYGSAGRDVFYGGAGEVDFAGLRGSDTIVGGSSGDDVAIYGQDTWLGGTHGIVANLQVSTSGGKIFGTIRDGFGTLDLLIGNAAHNDLRGREGDDTLRGGGGHDTFRWNQFYEIGEHDVIQGFHAGAGAEQDKLKLGVTGWGGTTTLHLVNGTAATAAVNTFLFNPTTHLLSWDPDGTGAQAAISIATLTGVSSLTAANFDLG
jgi:Ca2+-binding RTX toxin-like protein